MSRIGKKPILIPPKVNVEFKDGEVIVTGPRGSLRRKISDCFQLIREKDYLFVRPGENEDIQKDRKLRGLYGLTRTLINNMVTGVSQGFRKTLEVVGTGYKFELPDKNILEIDVGYSHKVKFPLPEGIQAKIGEKNLKVTIEGMDKQLVGEVAANIRKVRPPDAYKGKGIRYEGEQVKLKAGKAGKAATGAAG